MSETKKKSKILPWAIALHEHLTSMKVSWTEIAAKMAMSESGIRHWRNGTREIKVAEFIALCRKAGADPVAILQKGEKISRESAEQPMLQSTAQLQQPQAPYGTQNLLYLLGEVPPTRHAEVASMIYRLLNEPPQKGAESGRTVVDYSESGRMRPDIKNKKRTAR